MLHHYASNPKQGLRCCHARCCRPDDVAGEMQNRRAHDMAGIMQRTRKCRHPIIIAYQQGRRCHSLNIALNPSTSLSTQGMWKETEVVFPVFQGKGVGDRKFLRVSFFMKKEEEQR